MTDLSGILPVEKGGTGVTSIDNLKKLLNGIRIVVGSYTGTGSGENKIYVNVTPVIIIIMIEPTPDSYGGTGSAIGIKGGCIMTNDARVSEAEWGDNFISWHLIGGEGSYSQMNTEGQMYNYAVLGY